jgi:hypothetical protein
MAEDRWTDEEFVKNVRATLRHTQSRRPPGQQPLSQEEQDALVAGMLGLLHSLPDEPPRRRRKKGSGKKSVRRRKG